MSGQIVTEQDVMCGRCGSSMGFVECYLCGGEGVEECYGYPIECGDEYHTCYHCDGHGGFYLCLSSAEWCEAHPNVADVPRDTQHWFTYEVTR